MLFLEVNIYMKKLENTENNYCECAAYVLKYSRVNTQ